MINRTRVNVCNRSTTKSLCQGLLSFHRCFACHSSFAPTKLLNCQFHVLLTLSKISSCHSQDGEYIFCFFFFFQLKFYVFSSKTRVLPCIRHEQYTKFIKSKIDSRHGEAVTRNFGFNNRLFIDGLTTFTLCLLLRKINRFIIIIITFEWFQCLSFVFGFSKCLIEF